MRFSRSLFPAWAAVAAALAAPASAAGPIPVSIPEIQGASHASPLAGDSVTTSGVVTVLASDGFYLQDPAGDGDDTTSDAVFVFTGSPPAVAAGDEVRVCGPVGEFRPGGASANLTVTEIQRPALVVRGTGRALPPPVAIGPGGRLPPALVIDDDALARYEPASDGIDYFESLEGMRVRVVRPRVVQGTNAFGEVWTVPDGVTGRSARGALVVAPGDFHPARVQIDDALLASGMPGFEVGDALADVTGVVSYRFGNYEVLTAVAPVKTAGRLSREIDSLPRGAGRLRAASFNLHNLGPDDGGRFEEIARLVVSHLGSPDVVALQEIEDDSGPEDDGTVVATATLRRLVDAIALAGGPSYESREVAPADGKDGGAPGSNIRLAVLFDPARVAFVDRGDVSGSAETRVVDAGGVAQLTRSPGRIAPHDPAWVASRKPLACEFRAGGAPVFVVVAHFVSRSRSTPLFGATQPPLDPDAARRGRQANIVARFVADLLAIDPRARVLVLGDLNDDWFSDTVTALESAPLHNLAGELPLPERYSLLFDGNAQLFDQVLVSEALRAGAVMDVVHVAAEFPRGVSDHDPVVASVRIAAEGEIEPLQVSAPRPNPCVAGVEVDFEGGGGTTLRAEVFDVAGRRVRALPPLPADGPGTLRWDGRDDEGRRVSAGVYLLRLSVGDTARTRKVVVIYGM